MSGQPDWEFEGALRARWGGPVAGCDEAGRGPLAGPVVAAAVILPDGLTIARLNDSKQLRPTVRQQVYWAVLDQAVAVGVGWASPAEIDRGNILQASLLAMRRAVRRLAVEPAAVLIDGNRPVPGLALPQQTVVKGDARSVSVAAASVVAKVVRDAIMERLDALWPGYELASNKGYPAAAHLAGLDRHGVSPCHRTSFGPVRDRLAAPPPLPPAVSRGASSEQLSLFSELD